MPELRIRPSTKLATATIACAVLVAGAVAYLTSVYPFKGSVYLYLLPALIALRGVWGHLAAGMTTLDMAGDRLQYESGLLSKTTRSIPLLKVQDVTVQQTLGQRMLGLGDLSIETAGESSRLTIREINSPRVVAERILDKVGSLDPGRAPRKQ